MTDTLVAEWLRHLHARNYSLKTIETYTYPVTRFVTWRQVRGRLDLTDTTASDIDDFLETLGNHGPAKAHYAQALRSLFRFAAKRGLVTADPSVDCRPRMAAPEPPESYSREELVALLSEAWRRSPHQGYALALCYYTGTRRSEVTGFRYEDITHGEIEIRGKGQKVRRLPLSRAALECIEGLRPYSNGTIVGVKPQTFTMWVHRSAKACGFPEGRRNAHLLRATCADHLEEAGAPPSAIRDYLGHESIETTNRYLRRRQRAELADTGELL